MSASNSGFITGLFVIFVPLFLLFFFGRPPTAVQAAAGRFSYGSIASWGLTPVTSLAVDVPVGRWLLPFGPVS